LYYLLESIKKREVENMIGIKDISKTLRMMHNAAMYEFISKDPQRGIDILNDARILEERFGFKNQAAESMLEIAEAYFRLRNYDLALWFAEEAFERIPKTSQTSTATKATNLIKTIKEESGILLVT
jgi:hypothetical protein